MAKNRELFLKCFWIHRQWSWNEPSNDSTTSDWGGTHRHKYDKESRSDFMKIGFENPSGV